MTRHKHATAEPRCGAILSASTLTSTQISDVQRALFRNGFHAAAANGKWNPTFMAALEDFQK